MEEWLLEVKIVLSINRKRSMKIHTKLVIGCVLFSTAVVTAGYLGIATSRAIAGSALLIDKLDELMEAHFGIKQACYQGLVKLNPRWIDEKAADAKEYYELYLFGDESLNQYEDVPGLKRLAELRPKVDAIYAGSRKIFEKQHQLASLGLQLEDLLREKQDLLQKIHQKVSASQGDDISAAMLPLLVGKTVSVASERTELEEYRASLEEQLQKTQAVQLSSQKAATHALLGEMVGVLARHETVIDEVAHLRAELEAAQEAFEWGIEDIEFFAYDLSNDLRQRITTLSNETVLSEGFLYGLVLLSIAITLIISWFFSKFIYGPVKSLTHAVNEFEGGNLEVQVDVRSKDELGMLSQSFNSMTATLMQKTTQLELAKEEAERANQAKGNFLRCMSHELRTPLNAVLGFGELIEEEARDIDNDAILTDVKRITKAGNHLLALVNGVLELQQADAGKATVNREAVDLKSLCQDLEVAVSQDLERNCNSYELHLPSEEIVFISDHAKLRQALLGILENSCKFASNGRVVFRVRLVEDNGQPFLQFAIADNGIGIAEDKLNVIFDAFTQVDERAEREFEGTGLGLTISKIFIELLDGSISVQSTLGKGSCFTVRIPYEPVTSSLASN